MKNRKYVYAFKNIHNSISLVNYDMSNNELNSFIGLFNIWGINGEIKENADDENQEIWFECPLEFWNMLHSELFRIAFERMNTQLVFDYPYM